jgi:nitrogen fixation NifU-like protein
MYHPLLIDHFSNPRNAGEMDDADVVVEASKPVCGDVLKLWVKMEGSRISAVRFKCRGCVAAIACASALTEIASGRDLSAAAEVTPQAIEEKVGELPAASKHAAALAAEAWRSAVRKLSSR